VPMILGPLDLIVLVAIVIAHFRGTGTLTW
jgi:hypothetical protein